MTQSFAWHARCLIQWVAAADGGRRSGPPSGPSYFSTVVFVHGRDSEVAPNWPASGEHFSVELALGDPQPDGSVPAQLRFFAPELAGAYLHAGSDLLVMEGPNPVGKAHVLRVEY